MGAAVQEVPFCSFRGTEGRHWAKFLFEEGPFRTYAYVLIGPPSSLELLCHVRAPRHMKCTLQGQLYLTVQLLRTLVVSIVLFSSFWGEGREHLVLPEENSPEQSLLIPGRPQTELREPCCTCSPASRLTLSMPMVPGDSDLVGPSQPAESWGLRAPSTPLPVQFRGTVSTQVRRLVGGKLQRRE